MSPHSSHVVFHCLLNVHLERRHSAIYLSRKSLFGAASAKMLIYGSEYQEGKFIVKALINEIYLPPISNFSFF